MKINKILMCGLAVTALTACNDYLDVEAPSKVTDEYVFSNIEEADRLLNSVYESLCSNSTYGNAYLTTFNFNSDVEFTTSSAEIQSAKHGEWKLFDGEADGGNIQSTWNAAYACIERANNFVCGAEKSELYAEKDPELLQMIGEAKCIRAMNYLDLVIYFGDVPFTLTRTYEQNSLIMPMGQRDQILTDIINDLRAAAPTMKLANEMNEGVERCSKEYAWALIARIALFRAGYSLRPGDTPAEVGVMKRADDYADYYQIARTYADSVIKESGHSLTKNYFDVFTDECNYKVANGDDPIFEIPFVRDVNGNIGYATGPKADLSSAGDTDHAWGQMSAGMTLNAFYRFTFDEQDVRRNMAGFWSYDYAGNAVLDNGYTNYCMKWSKLWDVNHSMGNNSGGNTGINFPYMRYADVLLMFAEAENEINGPTDAAKDALKQVRDRAFRNAADKANKVDNYVENLTTKEAFFKAIVDERAWEFGGENIRWKDLVRWNIYNKVIYKQFWRYYGVGSDDDSYDHEGLFYKLPKTVFYKVRKRSEWNELVATDEAGKYTDAEFPEVFRFPNTDAKLGVIEFYHYDSDTLKLNNLWEDWGNHTKEMAKVPITGSDAWKTANMYQWLDDNTGIAKANCRCSLRGYIYIDEGGTIYPSSMPEYSSDAVLENLPPVRYILPIPRDVISRSLGQYKNYYGY